MPEHFWIAVEWVLMQAMSADVKSEWLRRMGESVRAS